MPKRPSSEFLRAVSAFRRFAAVDRPEAWEERFSFGLADIEQVFEAEAAADPLLGPPPAPQPESRQGVAAPAGATPIGGASERDPGDLFFAGAMQIARRVRAGVLSPVDVARQFLDRIAAHRHLNAFITVDPGLTMQQAEQLAARVRHGEDPGPLAGVPVGVKDLMPVCGYPLTAGTRAIEARVQRSDAPVVARLRAAGALFVGTTNLHELAYGVNSANPHFGEVQNPRHPGHIPGGSSGGSAAAVAAGLAVMGVGTCTGGSIRQPAACCGIVGFKPTYDAVPRDDVLPLAWSLDHVGPITRSVEDAALCFEVMAGLPEGSTRLRPGTMPPRIMQPRRFFYEDLEDAVEAVVGRALDALGEAGAAMAQADVPGIELAPGIQLITLGAEAAEANAMRLRRHSDGIGEDVRVRLEIGQFHLAADYVRAQRLRNQVRAGMIAAFGDADVMIVPAMPVLPPKCGTTTVELHGRTLHLAPTLTRFTSPLNFCGFPALSLPCGNAPNGLPVNLQVVGRPGADATVLAAARWCEQVLAR